MRLLLLLPLFYLIGCATSGPKQSKEVSQIKQDDFKKPKQVLYKKKDDYYSKVDSKFSAVSNAEGLQRIYLYDGDIELEGNLGNIAKYCYQGKYKKAEGIINRINKNYTKNPIFWNQVGTCYLLQKQRRKALLFYNKALGIQKNYAPSLNNLGVMYMEEKDFSRAYVAFNRSKKSKQFSKTPRMNLANLFLNFGLFDRAIAELKVLYRVSKVDIDVLNLLGTAYLMKNQPKQAVEYYGRIENSYLEEPRIGINYAIAAFMNGNKNKAKELIKDVDDDKLGKWADHYRSTRKYVGVK